MKSDAIKLELIEWLTGMEDEGLLNHLLLFKKNSGGKDWYDDLTAEQRARIDAGIEDFKQGRTVKSKDVWKKYGRKA